MKRIVECLLKEGIDEQMVHRILDLIEEEYEVVDEDIFKAISKSNKSPEEKEKLEKEAKANFKREEAEALDRESDLRHPTKLVAKRYFTKNK